MTVTFEQAQEAMLKVDPRRTSDAFGVTTGPWSVLFRFYNENRGKFEPQMEAGCRPCFAKVYIWVNNFLRRNENLNSAPQLRETGNGGEHS